MIVEQTASDAHGTSSRKSVTHVLALVLVWLTVALSAVVFSEPAPFDVLMIGLIVLLPITGLIRINAAILGFLGIWIIIGVFGLVSALFAFDFGEAVKHTVITIYLSIAATVFTAFVAKSPEYHSRLMMNAYVVAAIIASAAAIVGYFNLIPGFEKTFTLYGRARGTFKDPNVFGAFLVPAFVYCVHVCLNKPMKTALFPALGLLLIALGALLSFSRGAWLAIALALFIYGYLTFVTTSRNLMRIKLIVLSAFGILSLVFLLFTAMQFDAISGIMQERASFDQSYDQGPEGRFGGQKKALGYIVQNPLGIGALTFGQNYHSEEAHNVYLSMLMNAGWIGGAAFIGLICMSIVLGIQHAFRKTSTQSLFIVVLAAFIATAAESCIIDTDHWRHIFVLMGLLWGIMIGQRKKITEPDKPVFIPVRLPAS